MAITYFDERLNAAKARGYEQFVGTVINHQRDVIKMPKDSAEAMAWSQGMLEAAENLAERCLAVANGTDLISQLMGEDK